MKIEIDNKDYNVIITKKVSTRNIYIRVKEDLNIYVTANKLTSDRKIKEVIENNLNFIKKIIIKLEKRNLKKKDFYYLGQKYEIVYSNNKDLILEDDKVYINQEFDIDKWLSKRAKFVFKFELDKIYNTFPYNIPYPSLTIRKMKTRHGVCNTKTKRVTLNLELIKLDIIYLDYVIIHELSHLIYANHSKEFWQVVARVMPNYKEIRKELRNNE